MNLIFEGTEEYDLKRAKNNVSVIKSRQKRKEKEKMKENFMRRMWEKLTPEAKEELRNEFSEILGGIEDFGDSRPSSSFVEIRKFRKICKFFN